jgi:hypothetical protein
LFKAVWYKIFVSNQPTAVGRKSTNGHRNASWRSAVEKLQHHDG